MKHIEQAESVIRELVNNGIAVEDIVSFVNAHIGKVNPDCYAERFTEYIGTLPGKHDILENWGLPQ